MFKMHAIKLVIVILALTFIGCGKKDEKNVSKESGDVSGLIMKDSLTGKEKVMLKYVMKKGDKYIYKMTAKTITSETSPATEGKEENQDNEINYFYTKEVQDVDPSGIITYKVQYDSIMIAAKMNDKTVIYNSNVNDTVKSNPAFIQYNSVIKEPFFIRVTPDGEITDIYGLEKIHENLFKALGDTLKEEEKQNIKESFGKESMKEILQQEYQMFPKQPVLIDSSWTRSYNTQLLIFDVVNTAKYTLKGIEDKDNQKLANIDAVQNVEFLNKEVKQRGVKFTIENSETSGEGKITFSLNRGCITHKETTTTLNLNMLMSAQGQSAKSVQKVKTNLMVNLLN